MAFWRSVRTRAPRFGPRRNPSGRWRARLELLEGRLLPTAFLVDRLDDSSGSPGTCLDGTANDCTLRDAITKANSATGPHTISLDPSITLPATTTLTQGNALPSIAKDITIEDRINDGNTIAEWTILRGTDAGSYRILTVGSGVTATFRSEDSIGDSPQRGRGLQLGHADGAE
jgi:hypothetical protein